MERYWINQPSTLQPYHEYHGVEVYGPEKLTGDYTHVYFISGPIISMRIQTLALSPGWRIADKE